MLLIVREAKNEAGRGGDRGGQRGGYGQRSGAGFNRDFNNNDSSYGNNGFSDRGKPSEDGERGKSFERRGAGGPRGPPRGGRRFGNEESGEGAPRRVYERRSGTGHGNEFKRDGAGRGNWGSPTDEIAPKEIPEKEPEEKEPEEKQLTLEEYEKVLEEKRKALLALKAEERKVELDKELESMSLLSNKKKNNDEVFIKLGSEKDKRKEAAEKEERAKKSVSINEFLKPADGESYNYGRGGRGGRDRGRGGPRGGGGGGNYNAPTPKIEDPSQFPTLAPDGNYSVMLGYHLIHGRGVNCEGPVFSLILGCERPAPISLAIVGCERPASLAMATAFLRQLQNICSFNIAHLLDRSVEAGVQLRSNLYAMLTSRKAQTST
ncbi:hypothetical protein ACFE04_027566 [Oxalis oulophora]